MTPQELPHLQRRRSLSPSTHANGETNLDKAICDLRGKYQIASWFYDILDYPWERQYRRWRPSLLQDLGGDVLEAGVGTGRNLRHYPCEAHVVGADLSPAMLRIARKRAKQAVCNVTLLHDDVTRLANVSACQFDWYVATFLYCVLPDELQPLALSEMVRVLKPGGRFRILEIVYSRDPRFLFAVQHSVMARPAFKQWWARYIPPPIERSTYVLCSSLVLALLFWLWRPLPDVVWHVTHPIAAGAFWAVCGMGWAIVLVSTCVISHFDLFGLRQVYLYAKGQPDEPLPFQTPGLYRLVRHPLMFGFVIAFWATPTMTQGHLLFAAVTTAYILVAIRLDERDLLAYHGDQYAAYQSQVRMLLPLPKTSSRAETEG